MVSRALRESLVVSGAMLVTGAFAFAPNEHTAPASQGVVVGTVFDSLARRPLAGAAVQLARQGEAPHLATTRDDGHFEFSDLAAGRYLLAFAHPVLDSLGLEAAARAVDVTDGETARISLAIPSAPSIVRLLCPSGEQHSNTAALLGFVRSAEDGFPAGQSTVSVRFDDYVVSRRRVQRDSMAREVRTRENGYFVVCGVPTGVTVLARAP